MPRLPHHRQRAFWACPTVEVTGFEPAASCTCSSGGGAGAFQVLCQAELHLYCPFYVRADVPSLGLAVDSLQSAGLVVGISSGLVAHVDGGPVRLRPLGGPLVCGCSRGVMYASTHGILHSESWHWSSGFRLPYTIPLSRLVCIIANTMTYVNRSCSNCSMPL